MRSTLLKNSYPLELLNEKIFERYKKLIANIHKTNQVCEIYDVDFRESRKVITFPCIQNFQEQLCRIFKKTKLQIIFTIENTFQKKCFLHLNIEPKKILDQLKIKKIKPHLQNTLLPINIPLILKIQKL